jgi:DNA-binding HxlR family transcriptional regulator
LTVSKLEKKLRELEQYDIVEKVDGPSKWVSPVIAILKKNDEIRLCIDMRRANEAVIRERYCIPIVDAIIQDLNQNKVCTSPERNLYRTLTAYTGKVLDVS